MRCVFCDIAAGAAPASLIYRDDRVVAFCDTEPFTTGHSLVVPLRHGATLADTTAEDAMRMFAVARELAAASRRALDCAGANLFLADGQAAWQTVFHTHLHVIPRWGRVDRMRLTAKARRRPGRDELDRVAATLAGSVTPPGP